MEYQSRREWKPSIGVLLNGIINDVQELLTKEATAVRLEVHDDLDRMKGAAMSFILGGGILAVGVFLLVLMLVHLLHTYTELPLWSCYGLVGGVFAIVGAGLLHKGKNTTEEIDVVPRRSMKAAKEDFQWIKEHAKSERT